MIQPLVLWNERFYDGVWAWKPCWASGEPGQGGQTVSGRVPSSADELKTREGKHLFALLAEFFDVDAVFFYFPQQRVFGNIGLGHGLVNAAAVGA